MAARGRQWRLDLADRVLLVADQRPGWPGPDTTWGPGGPEPCHPADLPTGCHVVPDGRARATDDQLRNGVEPPSDHPSDQECSVSGGHNARQRRRAQDDPRACEKMVA